MTTRIFAACLLALAAAGCTRPTLTGTYTATGARWAAMVQLTEGSDHRLMGNVVTVDLSNDGDLHRSDLAITDGTVDAAAGSVALTMKPTGLLSEAHTVTGSITGSGIALDLPAGVAHLARSTPDAFDRASAALQALGHKEQTDQAQKKRAAEDVERVSELTKQLAAYDDRITAPSHGPEQARQQEEQMLAAARHDLSVVHTMTDRHQEFAADQARFHIGQIDFQMGLLKMQIERDVQAGHDHLAGFNQALAQSPCANLPDVAGCAALAQEQSRYVAGRARVESDLTRASQDMQKNSTAMELINKAAGN